MQRAKLFFFTAAMLAALGDDSRGQAPAASGDAARNRLPWQIMPNEAADALRTRFPRVASPTIQRVLDDPELLIYTNVEMPKAFQAWGQILKGVHLASFNVSANETEPFGNGNHEFPWAMPAGTHRSPNVSSFRFLRLPKDDQGRFLPVVWYRAKREGDFGIGYSWSFPAGAVLGEVLSVRDQDQRRHTFELRVRVRERDDWSVDVFRPFPRATDLARRIKELRPEWADISHLRNIIEQLETPGELPEESLDDPHPKSSFSQRMGVHLLPSFEDDELVAELLAATTFRSALGEYWTVGTNGVATVAPTTEAPFHVVPTHYDGGFVEVDRNSCIRCHETVNQHVSRFQPKRDWYGHVRGSDGIFSFHPFDPGCLSAHGRELPVKMRTEFVASGWVEEYNPEKHPDTIYTQISHLAE